MPFEPVGLPEHAPALGARQAAVQLGRHAVEVEEVEVVEHAGGGAVDGHLARRPRFPVFQFPLFQVVNILTRGE